MEEVCIAQQWKMEIIHVRFLARPNKLGVHQGFLQCVQLLASWMVAFYDLGIGFLATLFHIQAITEVSMWYRSLCLPESFKNASAWITTWEEWATYTRSVIINTLSMNAFVVWVILSTSVIDIARGSRCGLLLTHLGEFRISRLETSYLRLYWRRRLLVMFELSEGQGLRPFVLPLGQHPSIMLAFEVWQ